MNTPWGQSDDWDETLADGVIRVSTPSHGGIKVFGPGIERLSKEARIFALRYDGALWYEEDCNWAIVANELPDLFPKVDPSRVKDSLERWNQEYLRLLVPA